jgi:hypothetical protein
VSSGDHLVTREDHHLISLVDVMKRKKDQTLLSQTSDPSCCFDPLLGAIAGT